MAATGKISEKFIKELIKESIEMRQRAYCPYSKFQVGCVLVSSDGKKFQGCNVENSSYGLTICAERTAITGGVAHGMSSIKYLAVSADTPGPCTPCGACRQVIHEFSDENTILIYSNLKGDYQLSTIDECLPGAFTKHDLHSSQNGHAAVPIISKKIQKKSSAKPQKQKQKKAPQGAGKSKAAKKN